MVQPPAAISVTVLPEPLQTPAEAVPNVTGWPEAPPLAATVKERSVASLSGSAPNEIACEALATATLTVCRAAAAYAPLPAWSAATTHAPAPLAVSVGPLSAQGPESTLYETASPE